MDKEFNLLDMWKILWSNSKRIVFVALAIGIVTALISLFLPDYYRANTVFYAASPDLSLPSPLNTGSDRMQVYGNDYDIDRLISISESNELVQHLIQKFDLYTHYQIDSSEAKSKFKIKEKFLSLYEVNKTKYGAISLSVEDKDPKMASTVANEAREKIGEIAQRLIKGSQKKTLDSYYTNISDKSANLAALNDSLRREKGKYGIIDLTSQAEVLATNKADVDLSLYNNLGVLTKMKELRLPQDSINMVQAKISGLEKMKKEMDAQLNKFNDGAALVRSLESQVGIINGQVGILKERYNQLLASYNSPFTTLHVVEEAEKPVVKSRPIRSLITVGATLLGAMIMALLLLLKYSLSEKES